jgi:hypothetical protein
MFTYHQNRVLFLDNAKQFEFPCSVEATITLQPNPALGDRVPGLTTPTNARVRLSWNANTGRSLAESDPPLPPCEAAANVGGVELQITGSTIVAKWESAVREDLLGVLGALHFVLPLALGMELVDPVVVATTAGTAGESEFVWQIARTAVYGEQTDAITRNAKCLKAIEYLPLLCEPHNARLLAAVAYLQQAARLLVVGNGPSEFAGEAIINLAKVLEVLFPARPEETRDAARTALGQLGYQPAETEAFVSCLIIRSSLDAAHVRMATLASDERQRLQIFLERSLASFRELLTRIRTAIVEGTFALEPYAANRSDGDDLSRLFSRLPQ